MKTLTFILTISTLVLISAPITLQAGGMYEREYQYEYDRTDRVEYPSSRSYSSRRINDRYNDDYRRRYDYPRNRFGNFDLSDRFRGQYEDFRRGRIEVESWRCNRPYPSSFC